MKITDAPRFPGARRVPNPSQVLSGSDGETPERGETASSRRATTLSKRRSDSKNHFCRLPNELICQILGYVDETDLVNFTGMARVLRTCANFEINIRCRQLEEQIGPLVTLIATYKNQGNDCIRAATLGHEGWRDTWSGHEERLQRLLEEPDDWPGLVLSSEAWLAYDRVNKVFSLYANNSIEHRICRQFHDVTGCLTELRQMGIALLRLKRLEVADLEKQRALKNPHLSDAQRLATKRALNRHIVRESNAIRLMLQCAVFQRFRRFETPHEILHAMQSIRSDVVDRCRQLQRSMDEEIMAFACRGFGSLNSPFALPAVWAAYTEACIS